MKVYCLRHGRTNYNELELCNEDPTVDVYLTPAGIRQAEAAAERLRDVTIDLILVSELPRTRQTADIVNRYHGAPILVQPAINDIRTGFDGRPAAAYYAAIAPDPLRTRPPGGESLLEHRQRILGFLDWLRGRDEDNVLVVAHEETLRVCKAHFEGLSATEVIAAEIGNCEVLSYTF